MSSAVSQVSVNTCMHATKRAAERNITKSDIQDAKMPPQSLAPDCLQRCAAAAPPPLRRAPCNGSRSP